MPIYEDRHLRSVVDSLDENEATIDWYPANKLTIKLWQCLEALRDIDIALDAARDQKNATKRKRQLKQFSVQLHNIATAVSALCDQVVGDESARANLDAGTTKQVSAIKSEFLELVPISHKGDLSILRNSMGGHIDRDLAPWSARDILSRKAISNLGRWLHVCLHALLDLMKLDVYAWTVQSTDGYLRLMAKEPFLVTFSVEDGVKALVEVHMCQRSPRWAIADVVESIVCNSQWMFEPGAMRITSLKEDENREWNTFTGSRFRWGPKAK